MKRILAVIGLMLVTMCVTGCAATQKEISTNLKRQWMLVSMKEFSKDELIHAKASVDLTGKESGTIGYSAFMGCNNLRFQLNELNGNKLYVSGISGTKMFCPNHLDLENQFMALFPTMKFYSVEGHFLTLRNRDGEEMKFVAADWD
ncbi:META domain-containing protein [Elizabethkingia miricola]|uniref:META domain-containing protein n=1 Tax=Elizabethkingia bruuniana TaxID=1756149 RepID=UPI00099AF588|nr:META domain-containing protein [Elizabethkingia bruuniana]OPC57245.1 heat-shock protein [Elizabethkingia bruuniana]OPC58672.1 heat-shock protein [Elizabethkingia bruuniana]RBI89289.1 META domain-containing protein [Elizabethkingia miricola]